jgi:PAS domain S-box-containing protein
MPEAKILIVEDEAIEAMDVQQRLKRLGYPLPDIAYNGKEGVGKAEQTRPDLVLMDIMMPGELDGVAAAEQIRSRFDIPIIFLTAYADEKTLDRAKITAPYGYIVKPFQERELHITVDMALYRHKMEKERRKAEELLRESQSENDFLAELIRASSQPVGIGYPDGRLGLFNLAFEKLTGYAADELRSINWVTALTPPEWLEPEREKLAKLHHTGQSVRYEKEYIRKDGTRVPVELLVHMVSDSGGKPQYYYAFLTDLTERKRTEEKVIMLNEDLKRNVSELQAANASLRDSRRATLNMMEDALSARQRAEEANAELQSTIAQRKRAEADIFKLNEDMAARNLELETVNKELEAFIYSVSHDLRAPIRAMSGFAKIVNVDFAGKLDAKGQDYLERILKGSEKATRLINDLLHLSKISRQGLGKTVVDLSGLVSKLLEELSDMDRGRNVELIVRGGLTASADPRLIELALSNLLGNAWKFTSKKEHARIEFGGIEKDGKTVYFVKDNGAGFDMTFAEKIFWPFHRLHTDKEFEGTGIGLAIVERIIHRHGGKVWAEAAVGKGATFYFTLG